MVRRAVDMMLADLLGPADARPSTVEKLDTFAFQGALHLSQRGTERVAPVLEPGNRSERDTSPLA
jgi:hypothetical protein